MELVCTMLHLLFWSNLFQIKEDIEPYAPSVDEFMSDVFLKAVDKVECDVRSIGAMRVRVFFSILT